MTLGYDSFHNNQNSLFNSMILLFISLYIDLPKLSKISVGHSSFWCNLYAFTQKKKLSSSNGGYSVTCKSKKLEILSGDCNNPDIRNISFNGYNSITKMMIGSDNFQSVDRVSLENLPFLQSISVGSNSFTNHPDSFGSNTDRELIISNCTSLTNVTTDSYAFSDYNNLDMTGMRSVVE